MPSPAKLNTTEGAIEVSEEMQQLMQQLGDDTLPNSMQAAMEYLDSVVKL